MVDDGAPYAIVRDNELPPLSWFFQLGSDGARLVCGNSVETGASGFFEGAWAGDFDNPAIPTCADVFGSGAFITCDGWMLVPSSHTLECIYVLPTPNHGWLASNSLAYLLAVSGARLTCRWPETLVAFMQIVNGIADRPNRVSTTLGELILLYHHNAVLGPSLQIRPKPGPGSFPSYQAYRDHLGTVMNALAANAAHQNRRTCYRLLATVSSGYDSPACAAVASSVGCTDGLTFLQSRDGVYDGGCEIGECLGLQMTGVQHPLFSQRGVEDSIEAAEFFATGMQGEDIPFGSTRTLLRERMLVTGFHGDKIWDMHAAPSPTLRRGDVSGSSLGEFRLRENFLHVPLPFVGALQHASIQAISRSPEMLLHSIGGHYDRPVPRRIAEEAGVPRNLFGQQKKAVSTLVSNRALMPKEIRHAAERRIRERPTRARIRFLFYSAWFKAWVRARYPRGIGYLPDRLGHLYRKAWSRLVSLVWPQPLFGYADPLGIHTLEWSLSVVQERYRQSAGSQPPGESACVNKNQVQTSVARPKGPRDGNSIASPALTRR